VLPTFGLVLLVVGAASGLGEPRQDPQPVVSAVRAQLFENKNGRLSQDLLDPKYQGSWNSIAGPNAANATLVVVEVSGVRADYGGQKYSVKLVARETGRSPRILLTSTQPLPASNDSGKVYLPFLIYQTGCSPVRLSVTVNGRHPGKPIERTMAFACGE
jgi:hypothetical protein